MQLLQLQWRYTILPQLIDVVRGMGADDLLAPSTRENWFAQHGALDQIRKTALPALSQLDSFLQQSLELQVVVDGTGLARGARITTFRTSVDTGSAIGTEVSIEVDGDLFEDEADDAA
jgi:hypothetical protein